MGKKSILETIYGYEPSNEELRKINRDILQKVMEEIPLSSTGGEHGFARVGVLDPRYKKYSKHISGHTPNPEAVADSLQSNKEMWWNATKGFGINLLAGALDSFGSNDPRGLVNMAFGRAEKEYGNELNKAAQSIREWGQEVAPIFNANPHKMWSQNYWGTQWSNLGTSAGIMTMGAIEQLTLATVTGGAGNIASLGKYAKMATFLNKLKIPAKAKHIKNLQHFTFGMYQGIKEAHMNGMENYHNTYQNYIQKGRSEQEAESAAKEAATASFRFEVGPSLLLNGLQWMSWGSIYNPYNRGRMGSGVSDAASGVFEKMIPKTAGKWAKRGANVLGHTLSEGMEEGFQSIAQSAGQYKTDYRRGYVEEGETLGTYMFNHEFRDEVVGGLLGGLFFMGFGKAQGAIGNKIRGNQTQKDQEAFIAMTSERAHKNLRRLAELEKSGELVKAESLRAQMGYDNIEAALMYDYLNGDGEFKTFNAQIEQLKEIQDAIEKGDEEKLEVLGLQDQADENGVNLYRRLRDNIGDMIAEAEQQKADMIENLTLQNDLLGEEDYTIAQIKTKNQNYIRKNNRSTAQAKEYIDKINLDSSNAKNEVQIEHRNNKAELFALNNSTIKLTDEAQKRKKWLEENIKTLEETYGESDNLEFNEEGGVEKQLISAYSVVQENQASNHNLANQNDRLSSLQGMEEYIDTQLKTQIEEHETTTDVRRLENILGALTNNPRVKNLYSWNEIKEMEISISDKIKTEKAKTKEQKTQEAKERLEEAEKLLKEQEAAKEEQKRKEREQEEREETSLIKDPKDNTEENLTDPKEEVTDLETSNFEVGDEVRFNINGEEKSGKITNTNRVKRSGIYEIDGSPVLGKNILGLAEKTDTTEVQDIEKTESKNKTDFEKQDTAKLNEELDKNKKSIDDNRKGAKPIPGVSNVIAKTSKIVEQDNIFEMDESSIQISEIEGAEDMAPSPINPHNKEIREQLKNIAKNYLKENPNSTLEDYIKSILNSEGVSAQDLEKTFYYVSRGFYDSQGKNFEDNKAEIEKVYNKIINPFNIVEAIHNTLKVIEKDEQEAKKNQEEFQENKEEIIQKANEETQKETSEKEAPILRITRDGKVVRYEGKKTAAASVNVPFNGIPYKVNMRMVNGVPHFTYSRDTQAEENLLKIDTAEARKRAFMMNPALTKVGTQMKVYIPTLNQLLNDDNIVVPIWKRNDKGFLEKTIIPFKEWLKIEEYTQETDAVGNPVGDPVLVDKSPGSERFLEKVPIYMTMDLNGQETNMGSAIHDVEWWNERNVADFKNSEEYNAILDEYEGAARYSATATQRAEERARGLQAQIIQEGRKATKEIRERIWEETQANREGWESSERGVITEIPMEITAVTDGPTNQLDKDAPKKSIQESAPKDLMVGVILKGKRGLEFAYTSKNRDYLVLPNNLIHNPGILEETAKLGYVLTAIPFKLNEDGDMTFLLQMVDNGYSKAQPKLKALHDTKNKIIQTYHQYRIENSKDPNSSEAKRLRTLLKSIFEKTGTRNYENILKNPPKDGDFLFDNVTKHYPMVGENKKNPSEVHYQVAVNKENLDGGLANIIYFDKEGNPQVYKPFPESSDSSYVQMLKENIYTNHTYAEIRDLSVSDPQAPNATKFVANVQPRVHIDFSGNEVSKRNVEKKTATIVEEQLSEDKKVEERKKELDPTPEPEIIELTQGQRYTILNNIFNKLLGKFVTDKVNKKKLAEEMRTILEESMSSIKESNPNLYEAIMKDKDRIIGLGKYKDSPFTLREAVQEHFNIENFKEVDETDIDAESTNLKNHSKIAQEHDVRTSISSKLKRLFSGIPTNKKRGEAVGNIVEFMELDDVFSAVQDILADSPNDLEAFKFKVEEKIKLNPKEFGFLEIVLEKLLNTADDQLQREVLFKLNQSKNRMFFVYSKTEKGDYVLQVLDANSRHPLINAKALAREQFKLSGLIENLGDGEYKLIPAKIQLIQNEIVQELENLKNNTPNFLNLSRILSEFGLVVDAFSLEAINNLNPASKSNDGIIVELLVQLNKNTFALTQSEKNLAKENINLNFNSNNLNLLLRENNNYLNNFLGELIKVTFNIDQSMSIAGKTINAFSQPNFFTEQVRKLVNLDGKDLVEGSNHIVKKLLDNGFSRNSMLLQLITDIDPLTKSLTPRAKEILKELFVGYSSLDVLKRKESKSEEQGLSELSPSDYDTAIMGFLGDMSKKINRDWNGIPLRMAMMTSPTLSDSSQMFLLNTPVLDLNDTYFTLGENGRVNGYNDSVKQVLYEQLVLPEITRILEVQGTNRDTLENQMVYSIPAVNAIENSEGISLTHFLQANRVGKDVSIETLLEQVREQFGEQIDKTINNVISESVARKLTISQEGNISGSWVEAGFLSKIPSGVKSSILDTNFLKRKFKEGSALGKTEIAAWDFTINYYISQAQIQMLFGADFANYSKANSRDFNDGKITSPKTNFNTTQERADVYINIAKATSENLSKRLKAQISPGNRMAFSQGKKYLQIGLKDSIEVSSQFEKYIKSWYKNTMTIDDLARVESLLKYSKSLKEQEAIVNPTLVEQQKYKDDTISADLLRNYLKNKYPAIAGYLQNEATDAQEYTTWQEHLDISRNMGKLTTEEYNIIKSKLEKQSKGIFNEETTLDNVEKAIFQPMKPLHSGMYFRNMKDADGNETDKTYQEFIYVKSSSFALIPEMTRGLDLDNLRKNMEKLQETNKDKLPVRASYQTANKVGGPLSPINISQLMNNTELEFSEDNFSVLDRENFSIQQEKPFKTDKNLEEGLRDEVGRGTQIEKILLGNGINKISKQIFPNLFDRSLLEELEIIPSEANNISGQDLYKIYTYLATKEQEIKSKSFLRSLGVSPKDFQLGSVSSMRRLQSALSTRLSNKQDQEILELKYFIKDSQGKGRYITEQQLEADPSLEPVSAEFSFPIWLSPNSRKFESVLNSMVTNEFIKLKLPGNSFPVASEIGFKPNKTMGELTEEEKSGIIFTDNYNGEELLPERTINGVTYPAQVLIASKFRKKTVVDGEIVETLINFKEKDSNGKYIYLKEDGTLNYDKISPEVLQLFSFRIPTSAHQSGAIAEIVGFLPHSAGDLMVVPNEHTTKIGEDYDIDTRYTYSGNYIVGEDGKIEFLKKEHIPTFPQEKIDELHSQFEEFKDIVFQDVKERFKNAPRKENEIRSEIATTDFLIQVLENKKNPLAEDTEEIIALKEELEDLKASLDKDWEGFLNDFRVEREALYQKFLEDKEFTIQEYQIARRAVGQEINVIENEIINLFKSVYTSADNDIQKLITTTINTDMARDTAKLMDAKINSELGQDTFSIYDFEHQKAIMRLGSSGKLGIGVHSNWVVWNGLIQQSQEVIKLKDMYMRIGNFISDGTLGNVEALSPIQSSKKLYKNFQPRMISEINMENQNSATDNQKLQIMGKRNENKFTINVFALMNNLGFDKDIVNVNGVKQELLISSMFINQPIIRRYVELRESYASAFTEYTSDVEGDILQQLKEEFGSNVNFIVDETTGVESSFVEKKDYEEASEKMTGQHLFDSLVTPVDDTVQWVVFDKFLELQGHATNVNKVIQMMNIDKGLGVSYFNVLGLKETLMSEMNTDKLGIENVESLFGIAPQTLLIDDGSQEFLDAQQAYLDDGYIKIGTKDRQVFLRKPNSPNSAKLLNSISMGYHLWGNIFPFENQYFAQQIDEILDATKPIAEENDYNTRAMEIRYEALVAIRDYMYSFKSIPLFNDAEGNINTERRRLLMDNKAEGKQSLASYIVNLKKQLANNPDLIEQYPSLKELLNKSFFRNLEFEINEKSPSLIKYSINNTNSFNKNLPHTELELMLDSQETLPAFNGDENYTQEKLLKDLVKYSFLTNVENGAIGFRNYIPMSAFRKYGIDSKLTAISNMEIGGGRFFNIIYNGTLRAVTSFIGDTRVESSENGEYLSVPKNLLTNPVHYNSLDKILSNVNRTLGEGTLRLDINESRIYIERPTSQVDKSRFVRQFYQHNSELATKVQFKDAGLGSRSLVKDKVYVGVKFKDSLNLDFSAPQFITIRGENKESYLFELNQAKTVGAGATFQYKKINKLGGFGVNEFNPNGEVRESMFPKNNVEQEREVFPIRPFDEKTSVFNLPMVDETPSGLTIEQTLDLFKSKLEGKELSEEIRNLITTLEELLNFTDTETRVFGAKITRGSASYNSMTNLIKLDSSQFSESNIEEYVRVFAEEVIHSLTSREIKAFINTSNTKIVVIDGEIRVNVVRNNIDTPMPASIAKLVQLYKKGVESLVKARMENSETPITMEQALQEILALKPTEDSTGYRIQNLQEFVAGVFSDASFREKMNSIQYRESGKSILEHFAELIGRILNAVSNTISEHTIATTMDIITSLSPMVTAKKAHISQQAMQESNQKAAQLIKETSEESIQEKTPKNKKDPFGNIITGDETVFALRQSQRERDNDKKIKPGVSELFESNPELANEVYEAVGFLYSPLTNEDKIKIDNRLKEELSVFNRLLALTKKNNFNEAYDALVDIIIEAGKDINRREEYIELGKFHEHINTYYGYLINDKNDKTATDTKITDVINEIKEQAEKDKNKRKRNKITPEQKQQAQEIYSQYLNTIFPDSKVKDIVYHGTKGPKFSKVDFSKSKFGQQAFYISKYLGEARGYATKTGNVIPILINSKNIQFKRDAFFGNPVDTRENIEKELNKLNELKNNRNIPALQFVGEEVDIIFFDSVEKLNEFARNSSGWELVESHILDEAIKDLEDKLKSLKDNGNFDTILTNNDGNERSIYIVYKPEQIHILGSKQDIERFKEFVSEQRKEGVSQESNLPTGDETVFAPRQSQRERDNDKKLEKVGMTYLNETLGTLANKFGVPFEVIEDNNNNNKGFIRRDSKGNPTVVVNVAKATHDTPLHEYGHIFVDLIRRENKGMFRELLRDLNRDPLAVAEMEQVAKYYPEYNDNQIKEEVIVQLLGKYASEQLDPKSGLHKTIKKLWNDIKEFLEKALNIKIHEMNPNVTIEELSKILAAPNVNFNLVSAKDMKIEDIVSTAKRSLQYAQKFYDDFKSIVNPHLFRLHSGNNIKITIANEAEFREFADLVEEKRVAILNYIDGNLRGDILKMADNILDENGLIDESLFNISDYPGFELLVPYYDSRNNNPTITAMRLINSLKNQGDIYQDIDFLTSELSSRGTVINSLIRKLSINRLFQGIKIPKVAQLEYNENLKTVEDVDKKLLENIEENKLIIDNPEKHRDFLNRKGSFEYEEGKDTYTVTGRLNYKDVARKTGANIYVTFASQKHGYSDTKDGRGLKIMPKVLQTLMYMYSDVNYDTISFSAVSGSSDVRKGRNQRKGIYNIYAARLFGSEYSILAETDRKSVIPIPEMFKNNVYDPDKVDDNKVLEDKEQFSNQEEYATVPTPPNDSDGFSLDDEDFFNPGYEQAIREAEDSAAERALQEYEEHEMQESQNYFDSTEQQDVQQDDINLDNFVRQMQELNNDPRVIAIAQEYRDRQAEIQRRMVAEAERLTSEAQNISEEAPTYKPNFFNFTELKQDIFKNCR